MFLMECVHSPACIARVREKANNHQFIVEAFRLTPESIPGHGSSLPFKRNIV
jgi:hypothetical protein